MENVLYHVNDKIKKRKKSLLLLINQALFKYFDKFIWNRQLVKASVITYIITFRPKRGLYQFYAPNRTNPINIVAMDW